ncbi:uncharacterized protein [Montipora foliosa]|uniref:uncharacterized protein isoform X4 n=1 Tax=Montipora foliosa TaxID=591990 RepID=UPI0035F17434
MKLCLLVCVIISIQMINADNACGGHKTDISGHLEFTRGPKPHEIQCEWTIGSQLADHILFNFPYYEAEYFCGYPEIRVWTHYGKNVMYSHRCMQIENGAIFKEIPSSNISLMVKIWEDFGSPPFLASYVAVNGGVQAGSLLIGWSPNISNVTESSFDVQWPPLTNATNQPVAAYIVFVNWTSVYRYWDDQITGRILPSNATAATIRRLPSFQDFQVVVIAVDDLGKPFNSSAVFVRTLEGVPSEAPWIEKYNLSSNGSVQLYWQPISENRRNGIIVGYSIFYETLCKTSSWHSGVINVSAPSKNYTLNELLPGFGYRIRIAAFTSKGMGPQSYHENVWTSCAGQGILTEYNGTILTPDYPCQYGGRQRCQWHIRPNSSTSAIWIQFSNFYLHYDWGYHQCWSNDFVSVSTKESKHGTLLCGYVGNFSLLIPASEVYIRFITRGQYGDGFKAWYSGLNDKPTEINLSEWLLFVNTTDTSADLSWSVFPLGISVDHFAVKYTEVKTGVSVYLPLEGDYKRSYHLYRLLKPDRVFVFQVIAVTESGNDNYSSTNVSITTPEGAPALAPENVRVKNADTPGSIIIEWDALSEELTNGLLRGYTVYYRDKNYYVPCYYYHHNCHEYLGQSVNTSSSITNAILENLNSGKEYEISVAGFTLFMGPRSKWQRIIVGCGGSVNELFGQVKLVKYDWGDISCSWKISNPGLINPVLLLSVHMIDFRSCSEYARIFSSNGSELYDYDGCEYYYYYYYYYYGHRVIGELVEVPFGDSSYLMTEVKMYREGSILTSEFAILEAGKGLESATDYSISWSITGQTASSKSVTIDWSGFPNLNTAFFIISLNQTMPPIPPYDYYGHYNYYRPRVFLHMVHSNYTSAEVKGLPVYSEFKATVYLVDTAHDIYKSQTVQVETAEGYPTHPPRNFYYEFVSPDSAKLTWESIPEEHRNGLVIGYTIWYRAGCEHSYESPEVRINVSSSVTSYTINSLLPGKKYDLRIAGFTAAGIGHYEQRHFFTSCVGQVILTDTSGTIQSPGYPCRYGGIQECSWSIRPTEPTSSIWIFFREFSLSFHNYEFSYCSSNDRVGIKEGPNQNEVFFCNHMDEVYVLVRGNEVDVSFIANKHWQGQGFEAWYVAEQNNFLETPLPSWTMSYGDLESSSVQIYWDELPMKMDSVENMAIMITEPSRDLFVFVGVEKWQRNIHITRLSPNRVYVFKVVAFTSRNASNITYSSQNLTVRTQPGAPGCPPPNIRLETVQSTNLLVRWDPLPQECDNGELLGYKVYYRQRHYWADEYHVTAGPSETQVIIRDLYPLAEYEVWMSAFTFEEGPKSDWQSILIGCGGTFNQSFGSLILAKSDWNEQTCSWEINNMGLPNAVLLISVQDLRFYYCGYEYVRLFSDDQEFENFQECSHLQGELVVAPFGHSNSITSEIRIVHRESFMRTQFVILKGGLDSAVFPPISWDITLSNKTASSLTIDWSGVPVDLVASFFIISLNQTPRAVSQDGNPNKPMNFLSIVANSSQTIEVVNGLPAFTEFVATVYLVDINNDIYKSNTLVVETEESVPIEAPHLFGWNADWAENGISFWINPIEGRYQGGRLLGYQITYFQYGQEYEKMVIQVRPNQPRASLSNLTEGMTYRVFVSGFTSKGVGPNRTYVITLCGGDLQTRMGQFSSPNYPQTPYLPQNQWQIIPRCHWRLRPQAPNVSVITLTFLNFFLGRKEYMYGGYCSGGAMIYVTGERENDRRKSTYICGKETNSSFLIMAKNADIEAWGFKYHWYSEEFRENNGTKFLANFKASSAESMFGQTLHSWIGVHFNVTNVSALMTWSEPPSSFLNGSTVAKYLLIEGKHPTKIFHFIPLPHSGRQTLLEGLEALTNYTGRIIAILIDGRRGSTDWLRFQTKEGIPSRNPYIYDAESIDYSTIWIRWQELQKTEIGGILRGYRIHITRAYHYGGYQPFYKSITVGPNVTEYNITDLPSETEFLVWVAAFTAVGEGIQRRERWIRTKCGSTLSNSSGSLQSRGYPERMEYSDCIWHIPAMERTVFIWVQHYDIPYSRECRDAYVAIGDDSGIPPDRLCGVSGEAFALAQAQKVPLIYYSGRYFQGSGKGFELFYYVLDESFSEATVVADWTNVNISDVKRRSINVAWTHYSPDQPYQLVIYAVVCTPTSGKAGSTVFNVDKYSDREDVGRLHTGTNYTVEIVALVNNNQTGEVSLRKSQKVYVTTVEGIPLEPPESIVLEVYLNNTLKIYVKWRAIPSHRVEGKLLGYKVYYRVDGDDEFSSLTVGPNVHETTIDIANVPAPYEIRVAGFTKGGIGPMSWPRERLGCQATAISQMGVVTSPGFPGSTPGGMNCFNAFYPTFTPPVQRFLLVHVVDLLTNRRVEGAPNCTYWQDDYLGWATINPTVILAGPFCGKVQPFAFVSWGNFARPLYMGFFTGIGTHEREFNSTFFALHDFSKINISFISVSGHDAQLSWSASVVEDQIQGCVVLYKKTQVRKPLWSFKRTLQQNQTSLVSLLPLTNYTAWVLCYTSTGKVYGSNTIHFVTTGALPTTSPEGISPTPPPVIRMYPYGESAGDTELSFTNRCPRINVPGGGIRFFSTRFRELYICPYGTIQFEIDRFNQRPYNFGQRYWLRFSSMIAPYWTRTDLGRSFINGPSKVFYHIYTGPNDAEMLKNATSDVLQSESGSSLPEGKTFNATWVLVVTWVKLRHLQLNPIAEKLTNTFQAVLITDNIFTFVMFNYPHNGIQFSVPTSVSLYEYFSASSAFISLPVIGFNSGGSKNHYLNLPRSGTLRAEGIDNAIGNVGIPGRWILRIENSSGIEDSDFNCSLWYNNQPDPVRGSLIDRPDPCPCTVLQAFIDNRYTWVEPYFPFTECFYTVQPVNERGRRCCYYKDAERRGALILDLPQAGTLDRYHKLRFPEKHQKHDLEAFGYCCLTSRRRVESCKKYYEKRPSKGCRAYVPPQRAPVFGDPHLVTLDGKNYTFNGLGEYVMIDVKKSFFQLQARTKLAKGGGTATVFAAAVAKEENTSTLQCTLMEEGGLEVLINGQIFQEFHSLTNVSFLLNDSVAVSRPQNNSFLVTFPSGISVTVTEIQDSLSIVFAAPSSFQGQTNGLLGSWNGDQQDDFLKRDGTILPSNATGREIHFNFGLEWQLTDSISLFTYNPGENTSTFSNASFVPVFLDEPIDFGSDELRTAAELACQGDVNCLFDIASTGDVSVGASTKEVSVQIESESQALANFPPEILVESTEVNVTVNTSATITITAQDPNNDSLIFSVAGNLPAGHTTSTNQTSITISWSVTTAQIEVEFIVSDGTANTVHSPTINVCACQNQGICVQESSDDSNLNNNTEKFTILFCNCLNGYTGSFCEADLDACEENFQPCFPGVSCIDLPPPANASGYTCGPCPSGYSGDGAECSDIDECDDNNGGCDHNCVNTPGSSVCTCNSGYFLNFDEKSCEDVDECQSISDCMQICENTNGSYNCKCHADFEVDPEDPKNCIPSNPCQDNQPGCLHVCYQSDGQEKCSCYAGFSLNQDEKTCSDIDECASSQPPCGQNCSNSDGSYTCSCVTGFRLDSNGQTCNDIDECLDFTFQCQDESQKCENTYGSYKCICEEGLYWIDNKCQGLDKGEAPPPPPPAPEPKQPSEEERIESVNIEIQGLNTSEWNKPKEDAFKQSVAQSATRVCANDGNCISSSSKRKRRSLNNLIFTEDQVHLLPGYPKQVSQVPLLAVIAFYLQTPLGSSSSVINKNVVVTIVKSSVADISFALNATISTVQQLIEDTATTASTSEPTSATTISPRTSPTTKTSTETPTVPAEEEDPNTMLYTIIGGVVGTLVFVIIVSFIVWCLCRGKKRSQKVHSERSVRDEEKNDTLRLEMDRVKSADDIGYHNDDYTISLKVRLERKRPGSIVSVDT